MSRDSPSRWKQALRASPVLAAFVVVAVAFFDRDLATRLAQTLEPRSTPILEPGDLSVSSQAGRSGGPETTQSREERPSRDEASSFEESCRELDASDAPLFIEGVRDEVERQDLRSLLESALCTLRSNAFRANLRSVADVYPHLYVHYLGFSGPGNRRTPRYMSVEELIGVLDGEPPYRYVRGPARLAGNMSNSTAQAGLDRAPNQTSMTLGRFHLERWRSADPVERSCALNTAAHEITHLISNRADSFMGHFVDDYAATLTYRDPDGETVKEPFAVATYLIGTVAQCTWLAGQRYSGAQSLRTCIHVFGDRGHNGLRCTAFSGGRPIANRPDLPPPYVLVDRQ